MINTVEKIYIDLPIVRFTNTYKVTYSDSTIKFVPLTQQTQITKQYKSGFKKEIQ
jgi:hypothetical protein